MPHIDPACDPCLVAACAEVLHDCIAQPSCERTVVAAFEEDEDGLAPPDFITINNAPGVEGDQLRALYRCAIGPDAGCIDHCGFDGRDLACARKFDWPAAAVDSAQLELAQHTVLSADDVGSIRVQHSSLARSTRRATDRQAHRGSA